MIKETHLQLESKDIMMFANRPIEREKKRTFYIHRLNRLKQNVTNDNFSAYHAVLTAKLQKNFVE
jgi:hypothetical protein